MWRHIVYGTDGDETPVEILDSVPAEWDVYEIDGESEGGADDLILNCGDAAIDVGDEFVDVSRGGKKGKTCRSTNALAWEPDVSEPGGDVRVDVRARINPGKGHGKKATGDIFSPTSCGRLSLNDGAIAFEIDPFSDPPRTAQAAEER